MKDFDRFTEFLLREAAGYNEPPETPVDAIWPGVEVRLAAADGRSAEAERTVAAAVSGESALAASLSGDHRPFVAPIDYNRPPPAPREEMWSRIESAWALRRAVPASRLRPAWLGQRGAAGWVAALAAAASLVLGIGLGRGTRPSEPAETTIPSTVPVTAVRRAAEPAAVVEREPAETENRASPSTGFEAGAGDRVVVADARMATAAEAGLARPAAVREPLAATALAERSTRLSNRFEPDFDYVTARHLGRAATLLTAFRTDRRTPASRENLAEWARELLAETRMFIGLDDSASPEEQELLQDLELVLIQIAGLGPGAPDFEWDLARESMERQATLTRLRAASAESET